MAPIPDGRDARTPEPRRPARPARNLPAYAAAVVQAGEDPEESLRSIRRAIVGRWWVQVMPREGGFRGEAHTMSGAPGVWAGEIRDALADATADAIRILAELRLR